MAKQPSPKVVLPDNTEAPPHRATRRRSKPRAPARGTEEGKAPVLPSRHSSTVSTHLKRLASWRNSLGAAPGSRHPSIGPWMLHNHASFSGVPVLQPTIKTPMENTYRMKPDEGCKFDAGRVQRVLERALAGTLGTTVYSPQGSALLTQSLATLLHSRVKEVMPPRYKVVCQVLLGQQGQQSLLVASRALWDPETDSFASTTFSNSSLFAVATVHGVYFE